METDRSDESDTAEVTKASSQFSIPQRFVLAIMGFLIVVLACIMHICLAAANDATDHVNDDDISNSPTCTAEYANDHSKKFERVLFYSFYIGYMITQIPAGVSADKYGGKWVLALGVLSTTSLTLFTSFFVSSGISYLIILYVMVGMSVGPIFPALATLLAKWIPLKERGKIGALVFGAVPVGIFMGNNIAEIMLNMYAWQWVIYVLTVVALIWLIAFIYFCFNDPASHPRIKSKEREYLLNEIGERRKNIPIPWIAIYRSIGVWALISATIGHSWSFFVMTADVPNYMNDIIEYPVQHNDIRSSLPLLIMWLVAIGAGYLADLLIERNVISIQKLRKFSTAIAAFGAALFLFVVSTTDYSHSVLFSLLIICMGLMGAFFVGAKLSPLDMSPNYAGTLMGITNVFATIASIFASIVLNLITVNNANPEQQHIFLLTFFIQCITTILYCLGATAAVQEWNEPEQAQSALAMP